MNDSQDIPIKFITLGVNKTINDIKSITQVLNESMVKRGGWKSGFDLASKDLNKFYKDIEAKELIEKKKQIAKTRYLQEP